MPFTLLAHQAPVLPLKMWKPGWFSGTALVIGSVAPDVEYVFQGVPHQGFMHSLEGQLLVSLPLTLALAWIARHAVAAPLARRAPDLGAFHLRDLGAIAAGRTSAGSLAKDASSALAGAYSHIALDGITHPGGWAFSVFPGLATDITVLGHAVPVHMIFQVVLTLALGAIALLLLRAIGSRRFVLAWEREKPGFHESRRRRAAVLAPIVAFALMGAVLGLALLDFGSLEAFPRSCVRAFFRGSAVALLGVFLGCLLASFPPCIERKPF
ncbi:DUF4184 family protein [bacterium]|nr:DUF4184 family protein [bacterium]